MRLYSTRNKNNIVELKEAVLRSLPVDRGLYMPEHIQPLPPSFFNTLEGSSIFKIGLKVSSQLFGEYIPQDALEKIVKEAINFPAPLVALDNRQHILELFHGPSLAFKDFGARYMAQLMSYFNRNENKKLTILVATSGDTGGAVAAGFLGVENVDVVILYPSGKVSPLQEKQLTTLGQNIRALEVQGTFDDCQAIVKQAFLDDDMNAKYQLSSANSINIARLIPQSFYYFEAYRQLEDKSKPIAFCVPSGNFGNLTAGLMAKRLGLPVSRFIAATNLNNIVPHYLATGQYEARPSVQTISNAMDVGNPSNFQRMEDLYGSLWEDIRKDIEGYYYSDEETRLAIKEVFDTYQYTIDPHGAVGYLALKQYLKDHPHHQGVILETAHPAKFLPVMKPILGEIDVPERLASLRDKKKVATILSKEYDAFKEYMLS